MEAAGLASSIINFIDFSNELINGPIAIYQQAQGGSGVDHDTSKIVHHLQNITQAMSQMTTSQPTPHEQALYNLAGDCKILSNELVALLKSLEPKTGGHEAFRSLGASFKTHRKTEHIREIEKKLGLYESQLLFNLNVILDEKQRSIAGQPASLQRDTLDSSTENTQDLESGPLQIEGLESDALHLDEFRESDNTFASISRTEQLATLSELRSAIASVETALKPRSSIDSRTADDKRIPTRLTVDEPQQGFGIGMSKRRAKRISDDTWARHKDYISDMYISRNASFRDILDDLSQNGINSR